MSELTAIDILIDPDEGAMKRAREVNARLLESVPLPKGWALEGLTVRSVAAPGVLDQLSLPAATAPPEYAVSTARRRSVVKI